MKKVLFFLLFILFIFQAGCSKSVRYTHEEINDFPQVIQDRIKNGEIATGMTKLQVRYSWGGPHVVNVLAPSEDGKERVEWIYKKFQMFKSRLIFTDDILTEIISTEPGITR